MQGIVMQDKLIEAIEAVLDQLLGKIPSCSLLFADISGRLISVRNAGKRFNPTNLAALTAGNMAATAEIAKQIGENQYQCQNTGRVITTKTLPIHCCTEANLSASAELPPPEVKAQTTKKKPCGGCGKKRKPLDKQAVEAMKKRADGFKKPWNHSKP